jgi:hypothetical protein
MSTAVPELTVMLVICCQPPALVQISGVIAVGEQLVAVAVAVAVFVAVAVAVFVAVPTAVAVFVAVAVAVAVFVAVAVAPPPQAPFEVHGWPLPGPPLFLSGSLPWVHQLAV